jgi:hypothetical protein
MTMDLFEIVRERPTVELPDGRPRCPFGGCHYPFGAAGPEVEKPKKPILGTEWRGSHQTVYCRCPCCERKFERHVVGTNVWYTFTQDGRSVVVNGMPSCHESYVYHCAKCDGPVSRQYHQFDKDEPFPKPEPDENGIAISVLIDRIVDGKWVPEYRIKYACEACGHGGYTDTAHWSPPVQPATPRKAAVYIDIDRVEKMVTTTETWAGPAGTEVLVIQPCGSAVPNKKAVLCRLGNGKQGAMWEDELRRPEPEIRVLHTIEAEKELVKAFSADIPPETLRAMRVPTEYLEPPFGPSHTVSVEEIEGRDNADVHVMTGPGKSTETHIVHTHRMRRQRFLDRVRMAGPPPHGILAMSAPGMWEGMEEEMSAPKEEFWVHYVVGGVPHKAGPYTEAEAESHRQDIAGYEGVSDVVVRYPESTKPYNGEDMVGDSEGEGDGVGETIVVRQVVPAPVEFIEVQMSVPAEDTIAGCATCPHATSRFNNGNGATTCAKLAERIVSYGHKKPETRPNGCPLPGPK